MFGLPLIDTVVILACFSVVLAIGAWASRNIKVEEDFFSGRPPFREGGSDLYLVRAGCQRG